MGELSQIATVAKYATVQHEVVKELHFFKDKLYREASNVSVCLPEYCPLCHSRTHLSGIQK